MKQRCNFCLLLSYLSSIHNINVGSVKNTICTEAQSSETSNVRMCVGDDKHVHGLSPQTCRCVNGPLSKKQPICTWLHWFRISDKYTCFGVIVTLHLTNYGMFNFRYQ